MKRKRSVLVTSRFFIVSALACVLMAGGCVYDVPITDAPTRKIEEKLLGNWASQDGKEKMKVRKWDDSIYVVSYNGDLFRAYHSDLGKMALVSVQDVDSSDRKYSYMTWKLSDDGKELGLRVVDEKVIPKETKDSAAVRNLLEKNADNPGLFQDEEKFIREEEKK